MGDRIHLGLGYGVQLTTKEKKLINHNTIHETFVPYFRELYDNYANKVVGDYEKGSKEELDTLTEGLTVFFYVISDDYKTKIEDATEDKREKLINYRIESLIRDWILYPNTEIGSKSFFGYIADHRYDKILDYILAYNILKPGSIRNENIEIKLPPTNIDKKHEIIDGKNGEKIIIPSRQFLLGDNLFAKAMLERKKETNSAVFSTVEECSKFVEDYYKIHSYEGMFFEKGYKFVNMMFPDKIIDDIDRYIVTWWS